MNYKIPQPKKSVVRNDDDSSLNTEFFECGGIFFFLLTSYEETRQRTRIHQNYKVLVLGMMH